MVQLTTAFAQEVTPVAVAPHHAASLAFCCLVNSGGARPHVLRGGSRHRRRRGISQRDGEKGMSLAKGAKAAKEGQGE